jgi:hypothetical protein
MTEDEFVKCPIPGIMNKRIREELEVKGIGIRGKASQTIHIGVQIESGAGKSATRYDFGRSAQEVWRNELHDSSVAAGISSEGG